MRATKFSADVYDVVMIACRVCNKKRNANLPHEERIALAIRTLEFLGYTGSHDVFRLDRGIDFTWLLPMYDKQ